MISIPDSVTKMGFKAFYGCTNLKNINISSSSQLTKFDSGVFRGCSSLIEIRIPKSITYINESAFYGCNSLKAAYFEKVSGWSRRWATIDQTPMYVGDRWLTVTASNISNEQSAAKLLAETYEYYGGGGVTKKCPYQWKCE